MLEHAGLLKNKILRHGRHSTTSFRWTLRHKQKRQATARLGGKKPRGVFLVRLKLKWLKVKYLCMIKNLRKYYDSFVKDMIEGSRAIGSIQQGILLEASFALPIVGLFNVRAYPSRYAI